MAVIPTINYSGLSTYTDQLSQKLIREAVLAGTTFNYISVIQDVANSVAINYQTSVIIDQAGTCNTSGLINATGSVFLGQRNLDVCALKVENAICPDTEKQYWLGVLMNSGSYQEDLSPKEFAEVYTADLMAKVAARVEDYYWKGAVSGTYSATLNNCNGLFYILDSTSATSSVITSASASTYAGALTPTNAIDATMDLINTMVTQQVNIVGEPDLTMFMNYADFQTLLFAYQKANNFHIPLGSDPNEWNFIYPGSPNIRVVATRGINGLNKIVLTPAKNLFLGTDLFSDFGSFRIWHDNNSDNIYTRVKWKQGANCGYPQYIIYKRS